MCGITCVPRSYHPEQLACQLSMRIKKRLNHEPPQRGGASGTAPALSSFHGPFQMTLPSLSERELHIGHDKLPNLPKLLLHVHYIRAGREPGIVASSS